MVQSELGKSNRSRCPGGDHCQVGGLVGHGNDTSFCFEALEVFSREMLKFGGVTLAALLRTG